LFQHDPDKDQEVSQVAEKPSVGFIPRAGTLIDAKNLLLFSDASADSSLRAVPPKTGFPSN
jgi:hypothetical protein